MNNKKLTIPPSLVENMKKIADEYRPKKIRLLDNELLTLQNEIERVDNTVKQLIKKAANITKLIEREERRIERD